MISKKIEDALNAKFKGNEPEVTIYKLPVRCIVPFNGGVLGDYITIKYGENSGFNLTVKDGTVIENYDTLEEMEYALTGSHGILRGYKSLPNNTIRVPSKETVKKKLALSKRFITLNAERKMAREIGAVIEKVSKPCPTEIELKNAIEKAKEFLKSVEEI